MTLILKHEGLPVEVALKLASKNGLISQERLNELREELCAIVAEITVKFVGFFAAKSVKEGLRFSLMFLSFTLEYETKGAYRPDLWISKIAKDGFKGLIAEAIAHFKKLASISTITVPNVGDPPQYIDAKTTVTNCYRYVVRNNGKSFYSWYRSEFVERKEALILIETLQYLVSKMPGRSAQLKIRRIQLSEDRDRPQISAVINSILLRIALGLPPDVEITYDLFISKYQEYKKSKKIHAMKAKKRIESFLATLPDKYLCLEQTKKWFKKSFEGSFHEALGKYNGIQWFHVVLIPDKVMEKIQKGIPRG